ncbi:uncharacterized protein METZ01_LOCUS157005, partial [marine metagenome]
VPYPLCFANPYSGYLLSSSCIFLSLDTFAIIEAAEITGTVKSPLIIGLQLGTSGQQLPSTRTL